MVPSIVRIPDNGTMYLAGAALFIAILVVSYKFVYGVLVTELTGLDSTYIDFSQAQSLKSRAHGTQNGPMRL